MFHKITWSSQLLAGLTLFGVSFALEALVLTAYFGSPLLGFAVAGGLEASKVLAIVLYRVLREQTESEYPLSVRGAALLFRTALFALSAACSVMFLAEQLDRPNLAAVRAADLARAGQDFDQDLALALDTHHQRREQASARLSEQTERRRQALHTRYRPVIDDLAARLESEMDHVVNGIFKGPRYRELQDQLQSEKDAYRHELTRLDADIDGQRRALEQGLQADRDVAVSRIAQARDTRLAALRTATYAGDYRAEHPVARAFVSVLEAVFERRPSTLQFVFYFSLFLSLTMELGIMVAFEHITLARLPLFAAEHQLGVDLRRQEARTDAELKRFKLDDELARAKVKRKRASIEEALRGENDGKRGAHDTGPRCAQTS